MLRKLLTFAGLGLAIAAAPAKAADEINFGIISTETTASLKKLWDPFLADMAKQTGLKVTGFFASDYAGVIEAMRFNKVQLAWYGNKSAMEAVDRSSGEIFAQSVDKDGNPGYWSHIIVPADSPIATLEDMLTCDKSLNFGIGDPNSTSGFLVPMTFVFSARNIDPKVCFKTVRNANHEANALAVANKLVDAAANNNESLARLEQTAPDKRKQIKVIWTSPLIPSDPLVWRKDLSDDLKAKIKGFVLGYGTKSEDEMKVLTGLGWKPFKPSNNDQLLPVRQMEINKSIAKIKGDTKFSDDEKAKAIAPLEKQFAEIGEKLSALKK
jgi:phosphonate transport system substrate-binding protein